jgi:hypothetical protein
VAELERVIADLKFEMAKRVGESKSEKVKLKEAHHERVSIYLDASISIPESFPPICRCACRSSAPPLSRFTVLAPTMLA